MDAPHHRPRPTRARFAALLSAVVAAGTLAGAAFGAAGATPAAAQSYPELVPGHHGHKVQFPTRDEAGNGVGNDGQVHGAAGRAGANNLTYGGGVDGIGTNTGPEQVYVVFWGSQWGTAGTDGNGNTTFSNDPTGMAPRVQNLFKGIGTAGELWSGVMTQYCDGIAPGASTCPSGAAHVPYPTGGVLAGVWYDNATTEPNTATDNQLANEAISAAAHFGRTTAAANRNAQYVVVSPHGLHPGGFGSPLQWCAWHDYNGDVTLWGGPASSPYGDIAFTNLPYLTDAGFQCGSNFVNGGSGGTLDGVTIVAGHEYAETITDQNPAGGWTDSGGNENADKCAWISSGQGAAANVTFSSGVYPMQSTWSNDVGGCLMSHSIVSTVTSNNTVTVTNPGNQAATVGTAITPLQITASDSDTSLTSFTWAATGLPAGLSINSASGAVTGTPTTAGTSNVTVRATDSTGASGTTSFSWTVAPAPCAAAQKVANGGFESGFTSWGKSGSPRLGSSSTEPPHGGASDAWLGGYGKRESDGVSQSVTIPAGCSTDTLSFWLHVDTAETTTQATDTMTVKVGGTTLATYSNRNAAGGYVFVSLPVSAYAGRTVTLSFTANETGSRQTSFVVDDVAVNVS